MRAPACTGFFASTAVQSDFFSAVDIAQSPQGEPVIETPSPLENLCACAVSYLAGILFTLVLISYIDAAVTSDRRPRVLPPEA